MSSVVLPVLNSTSEFQTFLTLSLQDMASRVQLSGPQEAEKYVLHMVSVLSVLKTELVNFCPYKGHRYSL